MALFDYFSSWISIFLNMYLYFLDCWWSNFSYVKRSFAWNLKLYTLFIFRALFGTDWRKICRGFRAGDTLPDSKISPSTCESRTKMGDESRRPVLVSPIREISFSELKLSEVPLGSGKFGTVYRAEWLPHKMIVAVKRVLVLEKEADILGGLRHKNIVEFYGAVMGPHEFCIITGN